jgi:hypothetical protein
MSDRSPETWEKAIGTGLVHYVEGYRVLCAGNREQGWSYGEWPPEGVAWRYSHDLLHKDFVPSGHGFESTTHGDKYVLVYPKDRRRRDYCIYQRAKDDPYYNAVLMIHPGIFPCCDVVKVGDPVNVVELEDPTTLDKKRLYMVVDGVLKGAVLPRRWVHVIPLSI